MSINLPKLAESGILNLLVLDPSSSHLAYTYIKLDIDNHTAEFKQAGMVWTKASFNKAQRYIYMQAALELLASKDITHCISEQYFSNPRMLTGAVAVIPTINSYALVASYKRKAEYLEVGASTWRSILGIKKILIKGKTDYKIPTAECVVRLIGSLPATVPSNLDMRERQLPHDLTDVLGIALAMCKYHGVTQFKVDEQAFRPIQLLEELSLLSKDI